MARTYLALKHPEEKEDKSEPRLEAVDFNDMLPGERYIVWGWTLGVDTASFLFYSGGWLFEGHSHAYTYYDSDVITRNYSRLDTGVCGSCDAAIYAKDYLCRMCRASL